jgi:hypothetical protein
VSDKTSLLHELELNHVLVHYQHHVFEAIALLELCPEHLFELFERMLIDELNVPKGLFLGLSDLFFLRLDKFVDVPLSDACLQYFLLG